MGTYLHTIRRTESDYYVITQEIRMVYSMLRINVAICERRPDVYNILEHNVKHADNHIVIVTLDTDVEGEIR